MKVVTPALQALFDTGMANYCGIYSFSLVQGGSLYYASGDVDILLPSYSYYTDETGENIYTDETGLNPYTTETPASYQLYQCERTSGLGLDRKDNRALMHQINTLQVDTLTFDVIPGSSTINGAPFLSCVREGVFDGAELTYSGAFWPADSVWTSPVIPTGTIIKYVGRVAEVDASRNLATFTINSYLELLNQNMPRNLFSAGCVNTLYDASCALIQANFTYSSTVSSGSTNYSINSTSSLSSGVYNLGTISFTTGVNTGLSRTIKQATSSNITVIAPFPSTPSTGDAFNISFGCDKLQATCATRFANLANFRGFPFIPQQESAS